MSSHKKINVLVFPCGSENANEIYQSLRYSVHVNIIGASSVEDHGRFRYQNYISDVPNINDSNFHNAFSDIIRENKIDVVFATHDTVAEKLSFLAKKIGFFLINGDVVATRIARRKSETYALFDDCSWVPDCYKSINDISVWPVIIKPDMGQGGQGVILVDNSDKANLALESVNSPIIVEYLPGSELTVDCFTNRNGEVVWIGPRTRERVRAGITMRSQQVELEEDIKSIANTINQRMLLRGPWFFQLKGDSLGKWKLLEVSCRISGTMVFQRARGINLPLMAIHDYMGRDVTALPNNMITLIDRSIATRAKIDREYENIYIDLDDTLIIDGSAVPKIISFIYQSILEHKNIYLITRHEFDIKETLAKARISPAIFDDVYHIKNNEKKSDYIKSNSIFIDNHFPERKDVYEKVGCLVLDVDAVELLLK
ncbi:ATP-grasp domain-containing protein [Pectobacterium brasiliense]|uniref:ATP-grasp domain-containing protein n=1 Tax=Pectobacterium brasiliense TaxID=180957 RepID=UPI001CE20BDB|nr:ATP-grasp domain-containing protein [Pectobacterium brasiliense]MCA5920333.1 ATP-grasp domain-containing protein [Pectobacterium brasiliense]MCA5926477.1 ATP-grasp domain-containing protein [Pectobacterium brasiliense]MCA5936355.1 ATP-grasp domain-containing protein [Pectobacterium brasiliense]MCA5940263.1 ATP-grasp domain-containing protein [Pectobacterium brasiliense]MCA5945111.1 ATP-grasp domain-containing protein [Pectobacterium brasiliense]